MEGIFVYILANKRNGTLYVGMTNNLVKRITGHKNGSADGFTKKYGIKTLVYLKPYPTILEARQRENLLKKWQRDWKMNLIEGMNPGWSDLSNAFLQ